MAKEIDFDDPKYRFEERVNYWVTRRGMNRKEAEEMIKRVITTKEQD
jgi:hypothetical protein